MSYGPNEALGDICEMVEEEWEAITSGLAPAAHTRAFLAEILRCAYRGLGEAPPQGSLAECIYTEAEAGAK